MSVSERPSPLWNVPYGRNKFYTERDDALHVLHQDLKMLDAVALTQPQAITGLGGIGKTQMAVEYAYRYGSKYTAVLWVRADSFVGLASSFRELAHVLSLPERNEQDQFLVVDAVQRWLRLHSDWLLIFDNLDDPALAEEFLPKSGPGHLLFTTRAQSLGNLAQSLEIQPMETEIGALLLLRRSEILPLHGALEQIDEDKFKVAGEISRDLDGLPLALDQAGAFIGATSCLLQDYLTLYRTRRWELLQKRGSLDLDYPESVATTWSLSFEKVCDADPAAADLLNFCAFLAPDAIPENIITKGAPHLGEVLSPVASDPVRLDQICKEVLRYSLFQRNPDAGVISIHRLVQAVLQNNLSAETRANWKQKTVLVIDEVIPDLLALEQRKVDEQHLPHAVMCASWIEQENFHNKESSHVLHWAGHCLDEQGQYKEAESLAKRSLDIYEQLMGPVYPVLAIPLSNLAVIYQHQGNYEEAESLLKRVLTLQEQLGYPSILEGLNNLAGVYNEQGKYTEAEPLLKRSIAMHEQLKGPEYPHLGQSLNNLAALYTGLGRHSEAEPLLQRALIIVEQHLGAEHLNVARSLNNLGALYQAQGKYEEAEPLLKGALEIYKLQLGAEHPGTATSLNNLGALYQAQEKYEEAEPLLRQALEIRELQLGLKHRSAAESFNNLGALYHMQKKYIEAKQFYMQALEIYVPLFGMWHLDTTIRCLCNMAVLYQQLGNYEEAERLYRHVIIAYRQDWGPRHPFTKALQENHGLVAMTLGLEKLRKIWKRVFPWSAH